MEKGNQLIHTKLHLPFTRSGLVPRPRLQEQVAQGLRGPLTLVTAPAGFGKTTLVASVVTGCGMPIAWLSLDKDDNQARRFLNYLVAALQEVNNTIGSEAVQILGVTGQVPPEMVLTSLINDLDTTGMEMALVLDDYQQISSQVVHEVVAFILEHCPKTFHVVIATRSDPPLPLARLRARGQTVELRAADLSFTEPEAARFLNEIMGLGLDARSIAVLEDRTEGWIAGLQMVSIAMQSHLSIGDREDVLGFIEGFSGTNRYILDYLLEEVLASQPPEIQRFLLCTSVLERLTAPLCDVITEIREWGVENSNEILFSAYDSRSILEYLERANLFLVPLDDERIWYRYHQLFADLLRARLDQVFPGLSPQLHMRAATWLEQSGLTVEAVNHTLAAGEFDRAARMVEENTTRLLAQGEMNALMAWIEALPAELRLVRPWLCIHLATAQMFAGRPAEVEPLLTQAEAALEAMPGYSPTLIPPGPDKKDPSSLGMVETQTLKGAVAAIRAFAAVTAGKDGEAFFHVQQARKLLTAEDVFFQSLVAWATGRIMQTRGRLPEARLAYEEQIHLGQAMGHIWTLLAGHTYLAQVLQAQGQLPQARATLEEALTEAGKKGARSRGYIAWVETGLASVLYEQNELEAAKCLLAEAIMLIRKWPNHHHLIYAFTLQTRVLLAQGDLQGARIAIGEVDQIRRSAPLSRWLRRTAEAELVRVWLALQAAGVSLTPGNPLAEQSNAIVNTWRSELSSLGESEDILIDECIEIAALTLARVRLAAGRADEALSLVEPITRSARAAGHTGAVIGSLVLSAIALQGRPARLVSGTGRSVPALSALEEALCLAEPGGYIRIFLEEGQPMRLLLAQWLAHAGASPLRDYTTHLLSLFDAEPQADRATQEKVSLTYGLGKPDVRPAKGILVEPLSQRELEVLHLIALGRTNQEIARQLIVSRGTIKAHAASIYRKLDVTNRTEAVARARQLGILP